MLLKIFFTLLSRADAFGWLPSAVGPGSEGVNAGASGLKAGPEDEKLNSLDGI